MVLESLVGKATHLARRSKVYADAGLDPLLFWVTANGLTLSAWDWFVNYAHQFADEKDWWRGATVLGAHGIAAGVTAALNIPRKGPIRYLTGKIFDNRVNKISSGYIPSLRLSSARTLAQLGGIGALAWALYFPSTIESFSYDVKRVVNAFDRTPKQEDVAEQIEQEEEKKEVARLPLSEQTRTTISPGAVISYPKKSTEGRFHRALRWDNQFTKAQATCKMPQGLIAGLSMRESYGDPLQLNSGGDGGVGLMQFQPGTARAYGLKVYGNSNRMGRDRNHGEKLKALVRKHNYDYMALKNIDDRFSIDKSTQAAAKMLCGLYRQYGTWDAAVSAYNRGKPARNPGQTPHVRDTMYFAQFYNAHRKQYLARN